MSYSSSYTDGVPIFITKKLQPPQEVEIPDNLLEKFQNNVDHLSENCQDGSADDEYHFTLEKCVITKLDELSRMREIDRINRNNRIRRNELERARQTEEKQKQMLTAVQYPSADELSSSDEETVKEPTFSPSHINFDTILQPTIVPDQIRPALDTPLNYKLNYSDFENIETNPFDNIELKTINDLDILAQVLKINSASINKHSEEETSDSNTPVENVPLESQNNTELSPQSTNQEPSQQDVYNYNCNLSTNNHIYSNLYSADQIIQQPPTIPQQVLPYNHQQFNNINGISCNSSRNHNCDINYLNMPGPSSSGVQESNEYDSQSKSVPDILKELNKELNHLEERRNRNNSQSDQIQKDKIEVNRKSKPHTKPKHPESFIKLSPSSQQLVQSICQMGFPVERVSKIAEKFGNDDKKIVEHLIPLSELLDLGFDENLISDALLKFNNNKEKALDFLIS